jgi:DNA mismatch repair protein MutL
VIDQRAAHHRILYERLRANAPAKPFDSQPLLIPITLEFSPADSHLLNDHLNALSDMGLSIEPFGGNTFIIHAIPRELSNADVRKFIMDLISHLHEMDGAHHDDGKRDQELSLAASRAAISSKTHLSIEEAQSLVTQLFACETSHQCPRGRPTLAFLREEDLAKPFEK